MSPALLVGSMAVAMVRARSNAEIPVVMPSLASMDWVNAVERPPVPDFHSRPPTRRSATRMAPMSVFRPVASVITLLNRTFSDECGMRCRASS